MYLVSIMRVSITQLNIVSEVIRGRRGSEEFADSLVHIDPPYSSQVLLLTASSNTFCLLLLLLCLLLCLLRFLLPRRRPGR